MKDKQKTISSLLWITIIGSAMSFFGFVYEQIDFIPNYFSQDPLTSKTHWNNFHQLTNPAHYHIPASATAIFCFAMIWYNRRHLSQYQHRPLKVAGVCLLLVNFLTVIAVTQINDQLFFNDPVNHSSTIEKLAILWAILNFFRFTLTGICIAFLMRLFLIKLETKTLPD